MTNIKILRLHSGEDIMASFIEDPENEIVMLKNPMHVIFKRLPTGQIIMMMMPWLPVELITENTATLYSSDILTIVDPKENLIEYYNTLVIEANKRMETPLDLDMFNMEEDEDDYDEDSEIDPEELIHILREKKDKMMH